VYNSSGYADDLLYAAAWLHRATQEPYYLRDAKQFYQLLRGQGNTSYQNPLVNWDNQYWLAVMLMWEATGEVRTSFCSGMMIWVNAALTMRLFDN
jgi:endoglucanase